MLKRFSFIMMILLISALGCTKDARKGFFWKVQSKTATVYLLGSIHVGNASLYPLPSKIEEAYKKSDVVVTETDFEEGNDMNVVSKLFYPNNETLKDHLTAESYKQVKDYMTANKLPFMMFERFKAWYVAFLIQFAAYDKAGYKLQLGIDHYFSAKAKADKKERDAIESTLDIDALFTSFSDELNEKLLLYFIEDTKDIDSVIKDLYGYWDKGNLNGLEKYINTYANKQKELIPIFEKLIYERNIKMVNKIKGYLKTNKTYFVIIGSGHYPGKRGILQKLKDDGFKIE